MSNWNMQSLFESSVNSYGGQTNSSSDRSASWFESSVNSYGGQTADEFPEYAWCLRVVCFI